MFGIAFHGEPDQVNEIQRLSDGLHCRLNCAGEWRVNVLRRACVSQATDGVEGCVGAVVRATDEPLDFPFVQFAQKERGTAVSLGLLSLSGMNLAANSMGRPTDRRGRRGVRLFSGGRASCGAKCLPGRREVRGELQVPRSGRIECVSTRSKVVSAGKKSRGNEESLSHSCVPTSDRQVRHCQPARVSV